MNPCLVELIPRCRGVSLIGSLTGNSTGSFQITSFIYFDKSATMIITHCFFGQSLIFS